MRASCRLDSGKGGCLSPRRTGFRLEFPESAEGSREKFLDGFRIPAGDTFRDSGPASKRLAAFLGCNSRICFFDRLLFLWEGLLLMTRHC